MKSAQYIIQSLEPAINIPIIVEPPIESTLVLAFQSKSSLFWFPLALSLRYTESSLCDDWFSDPSRPSSIHPPATSALFPSNVFPYTSHVLSFTLRRPSRPNHATLAAIESALTPCLPGEATSRTPTRKLGIKALRLAQAILSRGGAFPLEAILLIPSRGKVRLGTRFKSAEGLLRVSSWGTV